MVRLVMLQKDYSSGNSTQSIHFSTGRSVCNDCLNLKFLNQDHLLDRGDTMEYTIPACSGKRIEVKQGQTITVVDIDGGQVVDFFAEITGNSREFLSPGVTIDCVTIQSPQL